MIFCRVVSSRWLQEISFREFRSRSSRRCVRGRDIRHPTPCSSSATACHSLFRRSARLRANRIMGTRRRAFAFMRNATSLVAVRFLSFEQNVAPDELRLFQIDEKTEAGFDWILFRRKIGTVERVTHFQSQRVSCAEAARPDADGLPFSSASSTTSRRLLRGRKLQRRLRRCNRSAPPKHLFCRP